MLYRHTKRHQALLQMALHDARLGSGLDLDEIREKAGLKNKVSSLKLFSKARLSAYITRGADGDALIARLNHEFLTEIDGRRLWDYLQERGYIAASFKKNGIDKLPFATMRELGDAFHCYLNAHEEHQLTARAQGLDGDFACYKKSFKYDGFIVKSRFRIHEQHREYFTVHETQASSGIYMPRVPKDAEETIGFGVIKSDRFWVIGREKSREQPRIFAFFDPIRGADAIHGYYGHVMEGTQDKKSNFLSFYVLLLSKSFDEQVWRASNKEIGAAYDFESQLDIVPYDASQATPNLPPGKAPYVIPEPIVRYILENKRFT